MGQVRHGSATTTHAIRAAIQRSQATNAALSREIGINVKTVAKWRKRETVEDLKTGPREARSTVLSEESQFLFGECRQTIDDFPQCTSLGRRLGQRRRPLFHRPHNRIFSKLARYTQARDIHAFIDKKTAKPKRHAVRLFFFVHHLPLGPRPRTLLAHPRERCAVPAHGAPMDRHQAPDAEAHSKACIAAP